LTSPSRQFLVNSEQTFDVCDEKGRTLTIRRINALDRLRLLKVAGPELSQNDAWLNMAALALSVVTIDGIPRATPVSERQVEAAVGELGDSGLRAVAEKLHQVDDGSMLFEDSHEGNAVGTPS
jgi:hypothetical protein